MNVRKGRRPGAPHKFPWTDRALQALKLLADARFSKPPTLRQMGERLKAAGLVDNAPDPATIRRALARMAVRS